MFYYAYTIILSQPSTGLEHANIAVQIYIHLYTDRRSDGQTDRLTIANTALSIASIASYADAL